MAGVVYHPGRTQHASQCRVLAARDTPVTSFRDISSVTVSRLHPSGFHGRPMDREHRHEQTGRTP